MADWPVAVQNIYVNGVLAYTPGHPVPPENVEANGWQELVAKPNTKTAQQAVQAAAEPKAGN